MKDREIPQEKLLTVRIAEHWGRLPREVVKSPPLEIIKTQLDMTLKKLL